MTDTPGPVPSPAPSDPVSTGQPLPCRGCGYDLAGLPPAGGCPECNFPVELSLADTGLAHSSPDYLARLHKGVFLILAGIIAMILLVITSIGAMAWATSSASGSAMSAIAVGNLILNAVSTLTIAFGWWLFTEPDPAFTGRNDGSQARKVIRITLLVTVATTVLNTALQLLPGVGSISLPASTPPGLSGLGLWALLAAVVAILAFVAWVVQFFAAMLYLRWLSPRIPNAKAYARAKTMMWLGPVLYFPGVLLCGIGPLIALVLYWNMLDWVRRDLKRLRAEQAGVPPVTALGPGRSAGTGVPPRPL
jgi:hypothetical protein